MAISFQTFTVNDESGFQAEHVDLLSKLGTYITASKTEHEGQSEAAHIEDQDAREEKILTLEAAKFQAEFDYLTSKYALFIKILENYPIQDGTTPILYFVVVPENNNNLETVLLGYV